MANIYLNFKNPYLSTIDDFAGSNDATKSGNIQVVSGFKGGYGVKFTNANDYLVISSNANFQDANKLSYIGVVEFDLLNNTKQNLFYKVTGGAANTSSYDIWIDATNGTLNLLFYNGANFTWYRGNVSLVIGFKYAIGFAIDVLNDTIIATINQKDITLTFFAGQTITAFAGITINNSPLKIGGWNSSDTASSGVGLRGRYYRFLLKPGITLTSAELKAQASLIIPSCEIITNANTRQYLIYDNSPNTTIADSSGNGNIATLTNITPATAWVNPVFSAFSKAIKLDGVNDYINTPDSNSLDITGDLTIHEFFKIDEAIVDNAYYTINQKQTGGAVNVNISWDLSYNTDLPLDGFKIILADTSYNNNKNALVLFIPFTLIQGVLYGLQFAWNNLTKTYNYVIRDFTNNQTYIPTVQIISTGDYSGYFTSASQLTAIKSTIAPLRRGVYTSVASSNLFEFVNGTWQLSALHAEYWTTQMFIDMLKNNFGVN